jgi:hypothetical protein
MVKNENKSSTHPTKMSQGKTYPPIHQNESTRLHFGSKTGRALGKLVVFMLENVDMRGAVVADVNLPQICTAQ